MADSCRRWPGTGPDESLTANEALRRPEKPSYPYSLQLNKHDWEDA